MSKQKLPGDFEYLKEMHDDSYFPDFLVNKLRDTIKEVVVLSKMEIILKKRYKQH